MKTKILTAVFSLVAILILLGGCVQTETGPIKIGWIGPQTGQSAVLGMDGFVAAQIAIDEINANGGINARQVELIIEDDQYDIAKAVTAYEKLVNVDGAKIILANTYGSVFALAEKAKQDGVIIIDSLDCNSVLAGLNDNIFCLATDSESIAEVLAADANKKGYDKVGIMNWNSDNFMPLIKDILLKEVEGEVVLVEEYSAGTKDFKTPITKMIDQEVDAIFLLGYDETGIAMKQARELGFTGQFYATGTITSPPLQEAALGNAEGSILAFWDAPKTVEPAKTFTEKFIAKQGRPVILDFAAYPTYDAVKVIAEAINAAGTQEVEAVKKALLNIQGFKGVTGDVSMNADGSVKIRESAFILTEGMPVLVE